MATKPATIRTSLESYRTDPTLAAVLTEPFIRRMEIFGAALSLWGAKINLTARPQDPAETAFHIVDSLMPLVLTTSASERPRLSASERPRLSASERPRLSARESPRLSPLPQSVVGEGEGEGSATLQSLPNFLTSPNRILDIGTGAGFPGLILASACPAHFTLTEARQKRVSFLRIAATEMALDNVEVLAGRLTLAMPASGFNAVIGRASGPAADFYEIAAGSLYPHGLAILYANPSQRLDLASAKKSGLRGYQRFQYSLRRSGVIVERVLAIWRAAEKIL